MPGRRFAGGQGYENSSPLPEEEQQDVYDSAMLRAWSTASSTTLGEEKPPCTPPLNCKAHDPTEFAITDPLTPGWDKRSQRFDVVWKQNGSLIWKGFKL